MRNKIQKYLSGDHEGFSLVELIIVIAIMAILIGVVALAVLPYLEKSRESKDLSTMDTVCSALVTAVADTQTSTLQHFSYVASTSDDVQKSMKETMGQASTGFKSSKLKNDKIICYADPTNNIAYVYASNGTNFTATQLNRTVTGYSGIDTADHNKPKPTDGGKAAIVSN